VWIGNAEATIVTQSPTEYVVTTAAAPQGAWAFDVAPVRIVDGSDVFKGPSFTYLDEDLWDWTYDP
jgi:hypothetical protein